MALSTTTRPQTLAELRASGWQSKTVKHEIHDNFLARLQRGDELFPGIVGYDDTVIPEINIALLAGHDMLFLGEKGQAKSRLMRLAGPLPRRGDSRTSTSPASRSTKTPIARSPARPATGRRGHAERRVPIAWWPREERYAERLAPGTKFADIIGEIDPAKLAGGTSMSAEEALHFGLIPRMHRGIFAMNEMPELDELVQVGLFNILEERDVQIRGYPIQFDIDVLILFSRQPGDLQPPRQGDPAAEGPHRLARSRRTTRSSATWASRSWSRKPGIDLGGEFPVLVPLLHEGDHRADQRRGPQVEVRRSRSRASAPGFSIANYRTMVASARQRGVRLGEKPAVPRISDLGHLLRSSLGKLELDLMGSHQMTRAAGARRDRSPRRSRRCSRSTSTSTAWTRSPRSFGKGVKIEVGDMLPSSHYAALTQARAAGVGEGVRGERRRERSRAGAAASSSCWPACTPPTASAAASNTGGSSTRHNYYSKRPFLLPLPSAFFPTADGGCC